MPLAHTCAAFRVRVLPPVEVEARRVVGTFDRDDAGEAIRIAQRKLQGDVAAERGSHEDRILEFERINECNDEIGVVVSREFVFLGPPLGVLRRIGLSMSR